VRDAPTERLTGHQDPTPAPAGVAGLIEGPVAPAAPIPEPHHDEPPPDEEEAADEQPVIDLSPEPIAVAGHPLVDEVMACRSAHWWARRAPATPTAPELRIADGFVRFQPKSGSPYPLVREDVCVGWTIGQPLSALAPRLLPPWACYRIVAAAPETS
jgi:hypothetical protein